MAFWVPVHCAMLMRWKPDGRLMVPALCASADAGRASRTSNARLMRPAMLQAGRHADKSPLTESGRALDLIRKNGVPAGIGAQRDGNEELEPPELPEAPRQRQEREGRDRDEAARHGLTGTPFSAALMSSKNSRKASARLLSMARLPESVGAGQVVDGAERDDCSRLPFERFPSRRIIPGAE